MACNQHLVSPANCTIAVNRFCNSLGCTEFSNSSNKSNGILFISAAITKVRIKNIFFDPEEMRLMEVYWLLYLSFTRTS